MKKSFVLYLDQYEPIKNLSLPQKGCLLDAIFNYQNGKKVECIDEVVEMAFCFLKQTFERDNEKWENKAKKNKENGKKGGRPQNKELITITGKAVPKKIDEGHFLYIIYNKHENIYKIGETKNLYQRRYDIKKPTNDLDIYDYFISDPIVCQSIEVEILKDHLQYKHSGDWLNINESQVKDIINNYFPKNPDGLEETQNNPVYPKKPVSVNVSSNGNVNANVSGRRDIPPKNPLDVSRFSNEIVQLVNDFQNYIQTEKGKRAPDITDKLIFNCSDTVDKLIRLDKFTIEEVRQALQWGTQDNFYSGQLFSLASLREKKGNGNTKFQNLYNQYMNTKDKNKPDLLEQEFNQLRDKHYGQGNTGGRVEIS